MSESDTRPGDDDLDAFREEQEGDYEPAPNVRDEDDLPVADDNDDELVPDDDRPVPLDPDDADIA
ncbi:hypothetical protein ACIRCZ_01080 [Leifsonia sp. NPDC102414]|uniref:hypothetical protein n=1 Tax=Leifsonia sp. NPDC102414 TaxID=3364124 RepID=UPI00381C5C89